MGTGGWARFLGEMLLLPFTAFVYSIDLFRQTLQEGQGGGGPQAEGLGVNRGSGGAPVLGPGPPAEVPEQVAGGAVTDQIITIKQPTREEEKNMSSHNWSGGGTKSGGREWSCGDENWKVSEECREQEPCDRLRLVRYKILFLKNKLEAAFREDEELVAEDISKDGFITWKIAEFIQKMERGEVLQPHKWHTENNYPARMKGGRVTSRDGQYYVRSLPDKDKKYLRVYSEVLAWYDREKRNYDRDKVDVLEQIRNAILDTRGRKDYRTSSASDEEPPDEDGLSDTLEEEEGPDRPQSE
jgi:hypothetical protein